MKYNIIDIDNAYIRFKQLNDTLSYRIQENERTYKDDRGKESRDTTYEIRSNSRIIITNLKNKEDTELLLSKLKAGVAHLLDEEYDRFKEAL